MPFTPLHLGFAWPVFMMNKRKLHFMCLSIGAMASDLEIFPMMPFVSGPMYARGPMHSLLGALTFNILVVLIFAYFVIPPIGRWFKRNTRHNWHLFAGVDVTLAPTNVAWALASAGIGTLSHITLDIFTHSYNPIFWPYVHNNVDWLLFGDKPTASVILITPLLIIILAMLFLYWTKPAKPKSKQGKAHSHY